MTNSDIQAFAAGWAAQAIRDALPSEIDFAETDLRPAEHSAVIRELERLANQLLAEALRLEAL